MIKLLSVEYQENFKFILEYSDGVHGVFDLAEYMAKHKGPLLEALKDEKYAKRCFIDAGALCWPNGLELSLARLEKTQGYGLLQEFESIKEKRKYLAGVPKDIDVDALANEANRS